MNEENWNSECAWTNETESKLYLEEDLDRECHVEEYRHEIYKYNGEDEERD